MRRRLIVQLAKSRKSQTWRLKQWELAKVRYVRAAETRLMLPLLMSAVLYDHIPKIAKDATQSIFDRTVRINSGRNSRPRDELKNLRATRGESVVAGCVQC